MPDMTGDQFPLRSERMLQLAYYRALEHAQFQGGFLARTAHELRSPLNKAISLHQMLLSDLCDDPDEAREFLVEAQAAALKMLEYLDLSIRISKIQIGRVVPEPQTVALNQIFEQVKTATFLQAADRNLHLQIDWPAPNCSVWADATWLRNVLTTLIDMAIDSCDRGTIRLSLAPQSPRDYWCIWLEDNRPSPCWQDPTHLPLTDTFDLETPLPNSLRLSLVEAMLSVMNGSLRLLATAADPDVGFTRLQCRLPRAPQV